ncbi:MAG: hypothetical protein BWX71_02857 [Deltaproteobacteria bacterium ADurb.Bin072]|nr:MAG: hypothetical protein BWX71_02857 [Deltaproteobacteria bacterium ADurb.Bin072]
MWTASAMVGITFSGLMTATRVLGDDFVMRMLPSFSTLITVPVAATAMLTPTMPMSRCLNFSRRYTRTALPSSMGFVVVSLMMPFSRNVFEISSGGTLMAGPTIWKGGRDSSWVMTSPRSVSKASTPFLMRWSLRPISSVIMDLPLVT